MQWWMENLEVRSSFQHLLLQLFWICFTTNMRHPGRERTISLVRDSTFWHGMTRDVEEWIQNCSRCLHRKTPIRGRAPLINIKTSQPLGLDCMDFLPLVPSKAGYPHLLIKTDHFTKIAIAVPTRTQLHRTTAKALYYSLYTGLWSVKTNTLRSCQFSKQDNWRAL